VGSRPVKRRSREMESYLSKAVTIIALTCFLVVGSAVAAILGQDSVPAASVTAMATLSIPAQAVVSNREGKADRLRVAALAPDPVPPEPTGAISPEPLRQAFAPAASPEAEAAKEIYKEISKEASRPADEAATSSKPHASAKPPVQKSYTLLSDAQIAGIKQRLQLSASQEYYWPAVETALRAVARRLHATRQADPNAPVHIDPDSAEVQQLKSAAMPLLFQLREDQKREVRQLARLIGLEKVAAMI
jgi:hypothetical protein